MWQADSTRSLAASLRGRRGDHQVRPAGVRARIFTLGTDGGVSVGDSSGSLSGSVYLLPSRDIDLTPRLARLGGLGFEIPSETSAWQARNGHVDPESRDSP